jgi:thiol-disulfide isomerase/thioredoxin
MLKFNKFAAPALILLSIVALLAFLWLNLVDNSPAPDVTFTTIEGKKISMASLKGKVVLVNFWATDCRSCVQEMPELVNIYKAYNAKGFEVIAVAMPYDPPAQVFNYVTQKALPFPVMHDGFAEMSQKFGGINATPTAFIFDKQGKRLQYTVGALDFAKLGQLLNKELVK